jgi:hypothetical protein
MTTKSDSPDCETVPFLVRLGARLQPDGSTSSAPHAVGLTPQEGTTRVTHVAQETTDDN